MIRFEHVSLRYGNQTILNDLNFEIKEGQFAVLIGPSGCGKTTTLKMINRLIQPDSGHIYLGGQDVAKTDPVSAPPPYWLCHSAGGPVPQHDGGPEHLRGAPAAEI